MDFSIKSTVLCCALLLLGASGIYAQNYLPYYGDPYYGGRSFGEGWNGIGLFERVESDLSRAAYDVYGSHKRINHALKEAGDVERQLRRGKFDRDEMGEAISAVDNVLDKDRLPNVDRASLSRDLEQMRRFRDGRY